MSNKSQNILGKSQTLKREDINIVDTSKVKQSIFGTAVGNAVEWFDFGMYAFLAVTIGRVFFPEANPTLQLILAFSTFTISFIARPVGGFIFGLMGDRIGRKRVLSITLTMMALATFSIGLIPSYETIGITAPILLLLARLFQGFSTGGEYAGAMTYVAESSPDNKRTFFASFLEVGSFVGYIFGAGLVTLLSFLLGSESMTDWGWRIPFLVAGPLGFVALYIRNKLEESPAFKAMAESEEEAKHRASFKEIITEHWKESLIAIGIVLFYNTTNYMVLTYMPSYFTESLGFSETKGLLFVLILMVINIPLIVGIGYLANRIGSSNRIIKLALVGIIILAIPAFMMMNSGNDVLVFLGLFVLGLTLACFQGTLPALLPSLFYTKVRYGALAISYNVAVSLFGGTTALIVTSLVAATGNNLMPAFYLMVASIIGIFIMSFFVKETTGKSLRGEMPAVETESEVDEVLKNPEEALWWKEDIDKQKATEKEVG